MLAWPASICTTFTIRVVRAPNSTRFGDGMAFVLAQDTSPSPSTSYGSFMGLFDQSNERTIRQLAVEFDTYKNEFDPDANHVAIDTNSVERSVAVQSLNATGISLTSGREITVRIEYDGWTKNMQVYVAYAGQPLVSLFNHTIKMKGTVPSSVYVGFTAATGTLTESHHVLSWNFTSIELPKESLGKEKSIVVVTVVPIIAGLLLIGLLSVPFIRRYHKKKRERLAKKREIETLIIAANGPKLLSYRKLKKATHNFSKDNLLGSGGFGSVYKGVLSDPPRADVAVKKVSASLETGEKQYLSEICTIGRMRHKNLVQLQGWCHDHGQLLLVYEYMANGSLDRYIGKGSCFLDWTTRYKILVGLASALLYLHEECENPVVHRDVKPNNVMLDSDFNAHLGDFGLARLLRDEASFTTLMAGTIGYLAPEVSYTGRAKPESDVYSFGMVLLEVVCGKRSKIIMEDDSLVDSVWTCYETGVLLDCVDQSLKGKYDEEQVRKTLLVALACLHPDSTLRPRMRKVVQIFMNPDEPLMYVPGSRPNAIWLPLDPSFPPTSLEFSLTNVNADGSAESSSPAVDNAA